MKKQETKLEIKTVCRQNTPIFNVLWDMKKNGLANDTIRNVDKALSALSKRCDLNKPEQVKTTIAEFKNTGYKRSLTYAYNKYVEFYNLEWKKPDYWQPRKIPQIPLENHIDSIIARAHIKTATALAISKDTGLRPIELLGLKVNQIDLNRGLIYPESAKHGQPRVLKLTKRSRSMLNEWIERQNLKPNDKLFGEWTTENYGKSFRYYRNIVAKKLHEPDIRAIKLYHLRHFYATMLLRRTKNIYLVKQKLGHSNIKNTELYAQIVDILEEDSFACEIAETTEQAKKLIENGYEYVTGEYDDGGKLFRKRK